MGALAPITHWIPEDDLLLKNAVEAGASLESLAKGAVQFSRRFTVRELQERWHSLLYDPVVSVEASLSMIDFERSALVLSSEVNRFATAKEKKSNSGKRKSGSVRSCYYALRKRVCSEPLNPMNLSFLVAPTDSNYVGNNGEIISGNFVPSHPTSNNFGPHGSALDVLHCDFPIENNITAEQDNAYGVIYDILGENLPLSENGSRVEELCPPDGLPVDSTFKAGVRLFSEFGPISNDQVNICSAPDGNEVFSSPISDCGGSFHNLEYSSPLPGLPIWRTHSEPALAINDGLIETDLHEGDNFELTVDDAVQNMRTSDCDVHSDSNLNAEMQPGHLKNPSGSGEGYYLEELSNSLFDFTKEDEFLLMDIDGEDLIDKSYYDGLSSLLLNSPENVNQDQIPCESSNSEARLALDADRSDPIGACPGDLHGNKYTSDDGYTVCSLEIEVQPSASASNSQCPQLIDGPICCTLNTEHPEIPCNDDIFLPNRLAPSTVSSAENHFQECNDPKFSSVRDFTGNERTSERVPNLPQRKRQNTVILALPHNDSAHKISRSADAALPMLRKEEREGILQKNHTIDSGRFGCHPSTNANAIKREPETLATAQDHQLLDAEAGYMGMAAEVANPQAANQEEFPIESDDDVPYFSDIEAMILDMDLDPDDQDFYSSEEVKRFQNEDTKKAIIRMEQGAYSYMHRAIASHGAFAVLYGRHSKHYIKKPEVLLGRATEDVVVDIDLGREGHANKISRRQAVIKMEKDGSFYIRNLGKRPISVNNKEIAPGHSLSLSSSCLIEIRGLPFIFETNMTTVKQYLNGIA